MLHVGAWTLPRLDVFNPSEFSHTLHHIFHPLIASKHSHIHHIMQNEYSSDSPSHFGVSEIPLTYEEQTMGSGFTITPKDVDVLQLYLNEFQKADTTLRTKIIEKAMAELYQLRPVGTHFDKKEASKVCRSL
jgi:hypothetical protein